jgi:DNA-binding NarL/FixJ family response regulator
VLKLRRAGADLELRKGIRRLTMSIAAIPSLVSTEAAAGSSATANELVEQQQTQPAVSSEAYSVQLTEAQRVYQLYDQGQQIPEIASNLNISVAAVNSYLNLANSGS